MAKKIFLICPVRGIEPATRLQIQDYITSLEKDGHSVYWPDRDTDQNDLVGLKICKQNRQAINEADEIHLWYDAKSQGSVFDFGMTFAFMLTQPGKRFVLANPWAVKSTGEKSLQNVLLAVNGKTNSEL